LFSSLVACCSKDRSSIFSCMDSRIGIFGGQKPTLFSTEVFSDGHLPADSLLRGWPPSTASSRFSRAYQAWLANTQKDPFDPVMLSFPHPVLCLFVLLSGKRVWAEFQSRSVVSPNLSGFVLSGPDTDFGFKLVDDHSGLSKDACRAACFALVARWFASHPGSLPPNRLGVPCFEAATDGP
jgi:hypothetical protein